MSFTTTRLNWATDSEYCGFINGLSNMRGKPIPRYDWPTDSRSAHSSESINITAPRKQLGDFSHAIK